LHEGTSRGVLQGGDAITQETYNSFVQIKLPDDLIPDIRSRAAQEGRAVDEIVAELLRRALAPNRIHTPADRSMLERRAFVGGKFLSVEWGVDLNGFNEGRTAERHAAIGRDRAWRQ